VGGVDRLGDHAVDAKRRSTQPHQATPEEGCHPVANRMIAQPLSQSMGLKFCGSDDQGRVAEAADSEEVFLALPSVVDLPGLNNFL